MSEQTAVSRDDVEALRTFLTAWPNASTYPRRMEYARSVDALIAENQHLRQALAQILDEAGAYHGSPNRKTNALHTITVKARTALDGEGRNP